MKKNYKPLDRRKSRAFIFNYDKMDIDEYWKTANYELDEDKADADFVETTMVQQKKYKKSFDKEYTKDLDTVDITGISESEICDLISDVGGVDLTNSHSRDGKKSAPRRISAKEMLYEVVDSSEDREACSTGPDCGDDASVYSHEVHDACSSKDAGMLAQSENAKNVISSTAFNKVNTIKASRDLTNKNKGITKEAEMKNLKRPKAKEKALKMQKDTMNRRNLVSRREENKNVDPGTKLGRKRRATTFANDSLQVEGHKSEKPARSTAKNELDMLVLNGTQEVVGVSELKNFVSEKSIYKHILSFNDLESGVLFMRRHASIKDEKAEQNMFLCILRGSVRLEIGPNTFALSAGSTAMVKRSWSYSVLSTGRSGSVMSVVFSG